MAMQVVGADVDKDELVISIDGEMRFLLEYSPTAIRCWLKSLHGLLRLALDSTGVFHLEFAC